MFWIENNLSHAQVNLGTRNISRFGQHARSQSIKRIWMFATEDCIWVDFVLNDVTRNQHWQDDIEVLYMILARSYLTASRQHKPV
ncbi:hypothetical protein B5P45_26910 [Phyllobacterium zundukense]|uniref:Uncharacterized protein n=1 Tax=Phyllobacterium zundukense TaxID=1867719 RepID=A0A2N9VQJ4_9HYPH|nr:hypothetical protein BLM14_20960 [Phyllobacterium zundukense]PIO41762.1 hypothetical protein B5P45_26910 [Phyllobacterium zundukense]